VRHHQLADTPGLQFTLAILELQRHFLLRQYYLSNYILLCFPIVLVVTRTIGGGSMDACPKCTHPHVVKAGMARGKQRWLCRGCGYQFTCTTPRGRPLWQKSLAVFLYCHGVSMN